MNSMNMNMNNSINFNNNNFIQNGQNFNNNKNYFNMIYLMLYTSIISIFPLNEIKLLKTEKEVLNYFCKKEELCIKEVNTIYSGNKFYQEIFNEILKYLFNENKDIYEITQNIYSKLSEINFYEIESPELLYFKINKIFNNIPLPQFLLQKYKKKLDYYIRKRDDTYFIMKKIKEPSLINKEFFDIYKKIRSKQIIPFVGIFIKYELLYLFISINYKIFFQKKYFNDEIFLSFLEYNETQIKNYFDKKLNFSEIKNVFNNLNENEQNSKKETYFNYIKNSINSCKQIYNIICSFFYLFYYVFKHKNAYGTNIEQLNAFIKVTLQNFVIFLDLNYREKFRIDFFELLNYLYTYDLDILINKKLFPELTEEFFCFQIENLLDNDFIRDRYSN